MRTSRTCSAWSAASALLLLAASLGVTPALAGSGTVELLFTTRTDNLSSTNISTPEQRLLNLIDGETVAIEASIDAVSRANVRDRLIAAHNRGVAVKVTVDCEIFVVDNDPSFHMLANAGIPVVDDNDSFDGPSVNPGCTSNLTSGFVHNKFLIFKGQQTVWTGSTNLTDYGFNAAQNAIAILSGNSALVTFYETEFNVMFGNGLSLRSGGTGKFGRAKSPKPGVGSFTMADGTVVEAAFSPYNYNTTPDTLAQTNKTIDAATSELLWSTYFLTYDTLRQRLDNNTAAVKRGVVDPSSTDGYGNVQTLINDGEQVLVTNFLGANHWKVVISNAGLTGGQVLVASHNFSSSSFFYNNENSVRILSPALASTAKTTHNQVWNDPQNAGLVGCVHSGESYNQNSKPQHRCNDAYDNDGDGLVDAADPVCAQPFTCAAPPTCGGPGAACSSGADCCSGTCYHGKTLTCK